MESYYFTRKTKEIGFFPGFCILKHQHKTFTHCLSFLLLP